MNTQIEEHLKIFHQSLGDSLRRTEESTYKLSISLITSAITAILPLLINDDNKSPYLLLVPICIGVFLLWWTTYFIITSSYQYRNLQHRISKIQEIVGFYNKTILDDKWKPNKNTCIIPEFYKSFLIASITGIILLTSFGCINSKILPQDYCCYNSITVLSFGVISLFSLSGIYFYYQSKFSKNIN